MSSDALLQFGLVVVASGALLLLVAAIRDRRHREHLGRIAARVSMDRADGAAPPGVLERASRFQRQERRVSLKDVLIGHGESRGTFMARRKVGRKSHQLLCFELVGSSRLDGFCVKPESVAGKDELSLHWQAPPSQWNDERALSMAARVMYNLSRVGQRENATPLGIELKGRRVWIYSRSALRGQALDRFVDDATRLQQLLLKSLARANEVSRTSSRSGPVRSSDRVTVLSS